MKLLKQELATADATPGKIETCLVEGTSEIQALGVRVEHID